MHGAVFSCRFYHKTYFLFFLFLFLVICSCCEVQCKLCIYSRYIYVYKYHCAKCRVELDGCNRSWFDGGREEEKKNASVSIGNNGRRQAALFTLRCRLSRLPSSLTHPNRTTKSSSKRHCPMNASIMIPHNEYIRRICIFLWLKGSS